MRVKVTTDLRGIERRGREGAERGTLLAAEHVLTESRRMVPLEEGTLERSGRVDADGLVAAVSYGGGDPELDVVAVVQHERLDYQHAPGRKAKYLESTMLAEADTVRDIIATEVRRALR